VQPEASGREGSSTAATYEQPSRRCGCQEQTRCASEIAGASIGYDRDADAKAYTISDGGIVVVPKNPFVP
jgi:hypothetical protein